MAPTTKPSETAVRRILYISTFSPAERSLKMAQTAASAGYDVNLLEWDRSGSRPRSGNMRGVSYVRVPLKAPYGPLAILALPAFLLFAVIRLLTGDYDLVQPRNLDTLFPTLIVAKLKRFKVAYDMADFYSDSYASGIPVLRPLARLIETTLASHSDAIILAGRGQVMQLGASHLPSISATFYNLPAATSTGTPPSRKDGKLRLTYVGSLIADRRRTLLNVIEAIGGLPIRLSIGGFGQYQHLFSGIAADNHQVSFLGRLTHSQTMEATSDCDLVILPFDPHIANYKAGLSTKFFEAISLAKPVVAPSGTLMGDIVGSNNIGFVADYTSVPSLREVLRQILKCPAEEIGEMGERARAWYNSEFDPEKIRKEYVELIVRTMGRS